MRQNIANSSWWFFITFILSIGFIFGSFLVVYWWGHPPVWWFLLGIIPSIGGIILFVFTLLEGTVGDNKYGPNPKMEYEII
ncbi:MAG: DUF805 domain-containing protein [Fibromonadaceae bacterium]|jgi:uncharacterized membrane protein YhaH (DUF805 family)|nr:DUF805 domain-containing protein [Fibromonadaceae bacterium]